MTDSTLNITQSLDNPEKFLKIVDNGDGTYSISAALMTQLIPKVYDAVVITSYDANDNPLTILYKTGGTSGTTVSTLTLVWASATQLTSIART